MKAPTLRRSTASAPRTGPVTTRRTARVAVEHSPARARWEQEAVRAAKAAAVGSVVPQLTPDVPKRVPLQHALAAALLVARDKALSALALRAHGRGKKVQVLQFMKVPSARFGEPSLPESPASKLPGPGRQSGRLQRKSWVLAHP